MLDIGGHRSDGHPPALRRPWHTPFSLELCRLRGARDELRGLAIETSFGFAFGLELATELVLFRLYRTLESMVAYSDRLETALLAEGWERSDETP
jgi:hypothetical protein